MTTTNTKSTDFESFHRAARIVEPTVNAESLDNEDRFRAAAALNDTWVEIQALRARCERLEAAIRAYVVDTAALPPSTVRGCVNVDRTRFDALLAALAGEGGK